MPAHDPSRVTTLGEPQPHTGGGGPSDHIRDGGFGGDGNRNQEPDSPNYRYRLRRLRLGVSLGMVSIIVLFIALTIVYVSRRGNSIHGPTDWQPMVLPTLVWINTLLLVLSSFTLEKARRNLLRRAVLAPIAEIPGIKPEPERSLPWLTITLILGNGFLVGQALAWMALQQHGVLLASNPSSSFFYLLTGTHAVHLSIGIVALLFAALTHLFSRRLDLKCLVVDVTSWYWHFMGVLWIYILGLIYFAR